MQTTPLFAAIISAAGLACVHGYDPCSIGVPACCEWNVLGVLSLDCKNRKGIHFVSNLFAVSSELPACC